jgi:hypothetical protein
MRGGPEARLVYRADEWKYGGLWHFMSGNREIVDRLPPLVIKIYHILSSYYEGSPS